MNVAFDPRAITGIDPVVVFAARAYLWSACEFDLCEAVDKLQHDAVENGLVAEIGQDRVQSIMASAFHRIARP
jgi:hypothetical protein